MAGPVSPAGFRGLGAGGHTLSAASSMRAARAGSSGSSMPCQQHSLRHRGIHSRPAAAGAAGRAPPGSGSRRAPAGSAPAAAPMSRAPVFGRVRADRVLFRQEELPNPSRSMLPHELTGLAGRGRISMHSQWHVFRRRSSVDQVRSKRGNRRRGGDPAAGCARPGARAT